MANMVATTLRKVAILEDQTTIPLFTMPEDQLVLTKACEYFKLRRYEELQKL
jgi:hypothetical protein